MFWLLPAEVRALIWRKARFRTALARVAPRVLARKRPVFRRRVMPCFDELSVLHEVTPLKTLGLQATVGSGKLPEYITYTAVDRSRVEADLVVDDGAVSLQLHYGVVQWVTLLPMEAPWVAESTVRSLHLPVGRYEEFLSWY